MAVRNPKILTPGESAPSNAVPRTEWFERRIGEFTHQTQLEGLHDQEKDEWFIDARVWYRWDEELVQYYIKHGVSSPEVDAFIKSHALGGR